MTQFRVLPAWRGDAFLLKSSRGSYLVDGGDFSDNLCRMLRERRVGKLRAAVCTFPSPERLGGILDLLDGGYPVRECWLPQRLGVLERMALAFNGDWSGWMALSGQPDALALSTDSPPAPCPLEGDLAGAATLIALSVGAVLGSLPDRESNAPFNIIVMALESLSRRAAARWSGQAGAAGKIMRGIGHGLLGGGGVRDLALLCCRLLLAELDGLSGGDVRRGVVQGLVLAAMSSIVVSGGETRVRYFRRSLHRVQSLVPRHPFVCLNGAEACLDDFGPGTVTPADILCEAERLSGNGRGLVFQFGSGECGALFCSDSKLSFLGSEDSIVLGGPTVITAPNHGGPAAEKAYSRIQSLHPEQDCWVRTHYSYARKISDTFKEQLNKLCLNNCVHRTAQETLLEFREGRWQVLAGGSCVCG